MGTHDLTLLCKAILKYSDYEDHQNRLRLKTKLIPNTSESELLRAGLGLGAMDKRACGSGDK